MAVTNAQRKRPDQTRRPRATIYYKCMKIRPEEAQGEENYFSGREGNPG